jgi:hypothetical protein
MSDSFIVEKLKKPKQPRTAISVAKPHWQFVHHQRQLHWALHLGRTCGAAGPHNRK